MRDLSDKVTTFALQATWLTTRDNAIPTDSRPSDGFARGQLAGLIVCTSVITLMFFVRFFVKFFSGTKMLLDDCEHRPRIIWPLSFSLTFDISRDLHRGMGELFQ